MRQKIFSLSFIYSGKWSNIVYLWGVFRQGNDYQMSARDLLYSMNRDTKPSLKSLDYTNPQSEKFCTNGGNKRPLLPPREVVDQQRSLQSRTCNSLRGYKSSQRNFSATKAFLTLANVNVHGPTIRRTLINHAVHGRVGKRKPLFSEKKIAC